MSSEPEKIQKAECASGVDSNLTLKERIAKLDDMEFIDESESDSK